MLQELAAQTEATGWAIASLLFFIGVWVVITVQAFRTPNETLEARARLALEDDGGNPTDSPSGTDTTV